MTHRATARTWRVTTTILVPTWVATAPGGGLPAQLRPQSRLPEQSARYGDITIAVRAHRHPGPDPAQMDPRFAFMELVADALGSEDPATAIEALEIPLTSLIDVLSFQMGAAIGVDQVNLLDITPPVAVGDVRTLQVFAGSPFGRFQRGVDMQAVRGQLLGCFPATLDRGDSRDRAALRWFVKSLATEVLHDEFIFLWIALEILCDASGTREERPYTGPCQHEISQCPECGRATAQIVRGATLRKFIEGFGIDGEAARKLWKYRQMMHGAISFEPGTGQDLASMVQLLRATVAASLKDRFGMAPDEPPLIAFSGLSIHPAPALGGTSPITEEHLQPLTG
jgi:hypothetical protein